jgi:hypothetical protein
LRATIASADQPRRPAISGFRGGPLGEVIYLSRLRAAAGSPVMFHRVRAEEGATRPVDVYEVLSLDGRVREALFLSMYHPRKSRKVPSGYTYAVADGDAGCAAARASRARGRHGSRFGVSVVDESESVDRTTFEGQIRDDFLKLVHASQDPRFKGKTIAIGTQIDRGSHAQHLCV